MKKKKIAKFTGKHQSCNFIEIETPKQVFSCELNEFFKNTSFTEHLWATTSVF